MHRTTCFHSETPNLAFTSYAGRVCANGMECQGGGDDAACVRCGAEARWAQAARGAGVEWQVPARVFLRNHDIVHPKRADEF